MNKTSLIIIGVGLASPLILTGLVFVIFSMVLGSEIINDVSLWMYVGGFFLFCGLLGSVLKIGLERSFDSSSEAAIDNWETIRLGGKRKYVLTFSTQISVGVIITLLFGFFFTERDEAANLAQPIITFVLLVLVTIVGAFAFSLELWKTKEYEFRKKRQK